jgi:sulfate transport system ATP-binding protein
MEVCGRVVGDTEALMEIGIHDLWKGFGDFVALRGVDLSIRSGELIALLGPSGSGKTTLLRLIAGLEFPDNGRIMFGKEDASRLSVRERRVGFVFQHYALFRHMTIADNVAFGLRVRGRSTRPAESEIRKRASELLELVQLGGLEKRFPAQLSGGQRQRVALARALAIEPRVLLLDEPFGALDAKVRKDLRRWLRELHNRTGYTTVFVTHDQEEALELADRVVVMSKGRIEQVGSTVEVYERPQTPFVFDFLGATNIVPGELRGRELYVDGERQPIVTDSIHPPGAVDVYVRPGDLRLADPGHPGIEVRVRSSQRTGPLVRCEAVTTNSKTALEIEIPHLHHDTAALKPDAVVRLRLNQFSIFSRADALPARRAVAGLTPVGEHRERGRMG